MLTNGRAFADSEIVEASKYIGRPNLMAAIPVYASVDHIHDHVVRAKGAFDATILGILKLKDQGPARPRNPTRSAGTLQPRWMAASHSAI